MLLWRDVVNYRHSLAEDWAAGLKQQVKEQQRLMTHPQQKTQKRIDGLKTRGHEAKTYVEQMMDCTPRQRRMGTWQEDKSKPSAINDNKNETMRPTIMR